MIWRRWQTLLAVVALGAGVAVGGSAALHRGANRGNAHGNAKGQKRQDRAKNGQYSAVVAGSFSGTGTAEVTDDTVSIRVTLSDPSGNKYSFSAPNLTVDGPYFSGTGKIRGDDVTVFGRVDAARASRVTASFVLPDGRGARIIGTLPASVDPPDDNWKDGKGHEKQ
jgi:hypothetical protein